MGAIPYGCNSTSTIDSCSLFCTAPSITTSLSTITIVIVGRALTIRKGKKRKKRNQNLSKKVYDKFTISCIILIVKLVLLSQYRKITNCVAP